MKQYEELELQYDFMFGKVMMKKELCRQMLERVLGEPIGEIEYPDAQKTLSISAGSKSVRLDVYVMDEKKRVYDSEMQRRAPSDDELPKRSRYYQGVMDLNLIQKGANYSSLNESYVIFICTFDPFGQGLGKYTFQNICLERRDLIMGDQTTNVYSGKCEPHARTF